MRFFIQIIMLFTIFMGQAMADHEKQVYGYIEKVTLVEQKVKISAKLDTGAKSASLNAKSIKEVTIDGKPYLRFVVPTKEGDYAFTGEYVGKIKIKLRTGEDHVIPILRRSVARPVVRMPLQLGDKVEMIRVNLTNRKHFIYPLLLGREALIAFNGVVDPSLKFTTTKKDKKAYHEDE